MIGTRSSVSTQTPASVLLASALALLILVVPVSTADAAAPSDLAAFAFRVIELTNAERARHGLPPLNADAVLDRASQKYAELMASNGCFSHYCGGTNPSQRLAAEGHGWRALGENIAAGQKSPEAVFTSWMQSAGHRNNILSWEFNGVGVGVALGAGPHGTYWVQTFKSSP